MNLVTDTPGRTLVALVRSRGLLRHRLNEMANCPSCLQETKDGYARDIEQLDLLIAQLNEGEGK